MNADKIKLPITALLVFHIGANRRLSASKLSLAVLEMSQQ
jgi:hypothetical protein